MLENWSLSHAPFFASWQAFVRYLQEQVRNLKQVPDPPVEVTVSELTSVHHSCHALLF